MHENSLAKEKKNNCQKVAMIMMTTTKYVQFSYFHHPSRKYVMERNGTDQLHKAYAFQNFAYKCFEWIRTEEKNVL